MLRASVLVFVAGWLAWFMVDKHNMPPPRMTESLVDNLQLGFDMLRAGHAVESFVYLWHEHYVVLSLLGGLLLSMSYGAVRDTLGRRRMRRVMYPEQARTVARRPAADGSATPPERSSAPAPPDGFRE